MYFNKMNTNRMTLNIKNAAHWLRETKKSTMNTICFRGLCNHLDYKEENLDIQAIVSEPPDKLSEFHQLSCMNLLMEMLIF